MRVGQERGFTLVELAVTMTVVGILVASATWEVGRTLPLYRVGAASTRFLFDLRSTAALAARTNEPVIFQVEQNTGGCSLRYSIVQGTTVFQRVCLSDEYAGVGVVSNLPPVRCKEEEDLGEATLPPCSLCNGGSIVFFPTGEVQGSGAAGDTLVFSTTNPPGRLTRAVGLRSGGIGKSRVYHWNGSQWECR